MSGTWGRRTAIAVVGVLALAAGCGGDDGEQAVEVGALAPVADRTEALERYRFEASISLDVPAAGDGSPVGGIDLDDVVLVRGEHAGDLTHSVVDLAALLAAGGAPVPGDVGMEFVEGAGVVYVRAPVFATLRFIAPDTLPAAVQPLADLGDGWGRIDLAGLEASVPAELAELAGGQAMDVAGLLAVLRAAAVTGGSRDDDARGTPVTVQQGTVTLGDLIEATGGLGALASADVPVGANAEEFRAALQEIEVDVEIAVDGDGVARRAALTIDGSDFVALAEASGPAGEDVEGLDGLRVELGFELFDVDDPAIAVELPAVDAVDLTPAFAALVDS